MADGIAGEATLEALGEAAELARPGAPGVVAVGPEETRATLAPLPRHGAARLILLRTPGAPAPAEVGCAVGAWLAAQSPGPVTALLPHTRHGLEVAAHLATRLDAALAPDAVAARRAADGSLEVTRPAYGDRLYATVRVPIGAAVVTLRPGALGVGPARPGSAVPVEEHPAMIDGAPRPVRVRRVMAADPRTVDLRDAERIVAGGRGVGGPEGFRQLQVLADLLGAAVGGSRVAVDLGWIPWERQIGQSGRAVAPELYLAFGISGASQHIAGIERARTVVAVNADREAPLLGRAQLAALGDWRPVAEALIERLRHRKTSSARGRTAP